MRFLGVTLGWTLVAVTALWCSPTSTNVPRAPILPGTRTAWVRSLSAGCAPTDLELVLPLYEGLRLEPAAPTLRAAKSEYLGIHGRELQRAAGHVRAMAADRWRRAHTALQHDLWRAAHAVHASRPAERAA